MNVFECSLSSNVWRLELQRSMGPGLIHETTDVPNNSSGQATIAHTVCPYSPSSKIVANWHMAAWETRLLYQYSVRSSKHTFSKLCSLSIGSFPSPLTVFRDFDSCYSHFMPYRITPSVRHRAIEYYRSSFLLFIILKVSQKYNPGSQNIKEIKTYYSRRRTRLT